MDELSRARIKRAAQLMLALGCLALINASLSACTFRERVAYEDCVRARCSGDGIDCEFVIVTMDPEPLGVRVCTKDCATDADCPADPGTGLEGRCVDLDSGSRCFPSCETEYDCALPLECDLGEGVCLPELL